MLYIVPWNNVQITSDSLSWVIPKQDTPGQVVASPMSYHNARYDVTCIDCSVDPTGPHRACV
jgi:hypothetical protein